MIIVSQSQTEPYQYNPKHSKKWFIAPIGFLPVRTHAVQDINHSMIIQIPYERPKTMIQATRRFEEVPSPTAIDEVEVYLKI